jgi:hypothetical protein
MRWLLAALAAATVIAGLFIWFDHRHAPAANVQAGQCLDDDQQVVDCESDDATSVVLGDGRPQDPNGPCQAYPAATSAITIGSNAGSSRTVCVQSK